MKHECFIPPTTENLETENATKGQMKAKRAITLVIANRSSSENVEGENPEIQTLTQEAANEQIRGFIAPLTRQLKELTRLEHGIPTSRHPNSYPSTELGTTSDTDMPQSDKPHLLIYFFFKIVAHLMGTQ